MRAGKGRRGLRFRVSERGRILSIVGQNGRRNKIVNQEFKGYEKESALARVAGTLAVSEGPDEVLSLSRGIHDEFALSLWVKPKLIRALAFSSRVMEAIEVMNSIDIHESEGRVKALVDVAEALTLPNAPIHQGLLFF